jgi:hypothetical protein
MDAGTLLEAIAEVSPVASTSVGKADDRATWSWVPGAGATQPQIDAGNNVVATIPIDALATALPTGDFIARWTNAEYKQLQLRRTSDNGKTAKDFDTITADATVNMNKKRTQTFKADCVSSGLLTQARADEIFQ